MNAASRIDELTLHDLTTVVWRSGASIALLALVGLAAALSAALLSPKYYVASTVLATVGTQRDGTGLGGLQSLGSQLGGLASLAGISLADNSSSAETIATLRSETLTHRFIREQNMLRELFASDWDAETESWKTATPPTVWLGARIFRRDVLSVVEDARTGLVTVSIEWRDPTVAAHWANSLVKLTNDHLRSEALARSAQNLEYLRDQLDQTSIVELRSAIFSLMETEIRNQMVARGNDAFALKVIDTAIPPERAASPRPVLWSALGFLLGLTCGMGWALIRAMRISSGVNA